MMSHSGATSFVSFAGTIRDALPSQRMLCLDAVSKEELEVAVQVRGSDFVVRSTCRTAAQTLILAPSSSDCHNKPCFQSAFLLVTHELVR